MKGPIYDHGFITGARLRVERANRHLNELYKKADGFLDRNRVEPRGQLDSQNFNYLVYKIAPNKAPPVTFGPVFGDTVHNLRAALDHIAWNLAQRNLIGAGREPYQLTAFPLIKNFTDGRIDRFCELVQDTLPAAIPDIFDLQPAHSTNPADHPLAVLDRLWNADKHRVNIKIVNRQHVPSVTRSGVQIRIENLQDGMRRITVPRGLKKQFEEYFRSEILFEIPKTQERVHLGVLRLLHDYMRDEVIKRFACFLPESTGLVERSQGIAKY